MRALADLEVQAHNLAGTGAAIAGSRFPRATSASGFPEKRPSQFGLLGVLSFMRRIAHHAARAKKASTQKNTSPHTWTLCGQNPVFVQTIVPETLENRGTTQNT